MNDNENDKTNTCRLCPKHLPKLNHDLPFNLNIISKTIVSSTNPSRNNNSLTHLQTYRVLSFFLKLYVNTVFRVEQKPNHAIQLKLRDLSMSKLFSTY